MNEEQARELIERYLQGNCTPQEEVIVNAWIDELGDKAPVESLDKALFNAILNQKLTENIGFGVIEEQPAQIHAVKRASIIRRWWWAAASILLVVTAAWLWTTTPAKQNAATIAKTDSIAPGRELAVLTLADGSTILLDSTGNGTLATQQGSNVIKKDGQVIYQPAGTTGVTTLSYNTMQTPRGGQYQLTLSDGSRVWLNAASSIRYPAVFPNHERSVEITGEAYFEIAKDHSRPFRVTSGNQVVQVLGTHFNINAYADEESIKTTLLEGSVKISAAQTGASKTLKPGQQSQLNNIDQLTVQSGVNTAQAVSWRQGFFQFQDTDIQAVMRQLSRWYDLQVSYEGKLTQRFSGAIKRTASFSSVVQFLEGENLHVKQQGKHITITSKPD